MPRDKSTFSVMDVVKVDEKPSLVVCEPDKESILDGSTHDPAGRELNLEARLQEIADDLGVRPIYKDIGEDVIEKGSESSHPGFQSAQEQIAAKQGISKERAGAILAASTRRASPAARAKNPNLNKVRGVAKHLDDSLIVEKGAMKDLAWALSTRAKNKLPAIPLSSRKAALGAARREEEWQKAGDSLMAEGWNRAKRWHLKHGQKKLDNGVIERKLKQPPKPEGLEIGDKRRRRESIWVPLDEKRFSSSKIVAKHLDDSLIVEKQYRVKDGDRLPLSKVPANLRKEWMYMHEVAGEKPDTNAKFETWTDKDGYRVWGVVRRDGTVAGKDDKCLSDSLIVEKGTLPLKPPPAPGPMGPKISDKFRKKIDYYITRFNPQRKTRVLDDERSMIAEEVSHGKSFDKRGKRVEDRGLSGFSKRFDDIWKGRDDLYDRKKFKELDDSLIVEKGPIRFLLNRYHPTEVAEGKPVYDAIKKTKKVIGLTENDEKKTKAYIPEAKTKRIALAKRNILETAVGAGNAKLNLKPMKAKELDDSLIVEKGRFTSRPDFRSAKRVIGEEVKSLAQSLSARAKNKLPIPNLKDRKAAFYSAWYKDQLGFDEKHLRSPKSIEVNREASERTSKELWQTLNKDRYHEKTPLNADDAAIIRNRKNRRDVIKELDDSLIVIKEAKDTTARDLAIASTIGVGAGILGMGLLSRGRTAKKIRPTKTPGRPQLPPGEPIDLRRGYDGVWKGFLQNIISRFKPKPFSRSGATVLSESEAANFAKNEAKKRAAREAERAAQIPKPETQQASAPKDPFWRGVKYGVGGTLAAGGAGAYYGLKPQENQNIVKRKGLKKIYYYDDGFKYRRKRGLGTSHRAL